MPITARAIKKLVHDRKRTIQNIAVRKNTKKAVQLMRKSPTAKHLSEAFAVLDKAAKHSVIHVNKASRIKARLSKLLKKK